jgi:uncharacterized protein YbjT (DUF2867 family)
MRIVLLGGSGFVGRVLLQRLHQDGHHMVLLSRDGERHKDLRVLPRLTLISADPYQQETLEKYFTGADVVINLVGILNESGNSGAGFRLAHVTLTQTIIAAMHASGIKRLLQMSSLRAGEGSSHYLCTRGEAETLVKASALNWTIFQPSVIFGPGDGLFCRFRDLLKIAPVLPLARASAKFQPVFVGDVAEAMARTLSDKKSIGQTYALVGPQTVTLKEIVELTAETMGWRRLVIALPDVLAKAQAAVFDLLPLSLKAFSSDNLRSLMLDSVSERSGLLELGIAPTAMRGVVEKYLKN